MEYIKWYKKEDSLRTSDNKEIKVLRFESECNDSILDEWARHFRNNYRTLEEVNDEILDRDISRADYYKNEIFPDPKEKPGPSTRVGDFCELMLSDYIEYALEYYVPRYK